MRAVLSMAFIVFATVAQAAGPVTVDPAAPPARLISEYNLFKDASRQLPNDGVVPYDVNTALFSDYAEKHRFVYVPEGKSAEYREMEPFLFPVGSVLVKTFSFLHDMRDPKQGERIIETRLLIKNDKNQWIGIPYRWKEDMSDAALAVAGATVDVEWIHYNGALRSLNYIVPNMNQCKQCHENEGQLLPIGPKAMHLNKDFDYGDTMENQLIHWANLGILTGLPKNLDAAPRLPDAEDPASGSLDARARAWLDINCAHCHNPKGPAYTSGLDLSFHQHDPAQFGVNKPPVAAGRGSGNLRFSIVPGAPEASILHFRVNSTDPGIMMPPLPRRVIDEEGLALLREWIAGMAK